MSKESKTVLYNEVVIPPFGIEADHPRNSDLLIQGIPGCRLRSAIKPVKEVWGLDDEGDRVKEMQPANMFKGLPMTPGVQIHVNPQEGTFKVIDPIEERTLERVKAVMERQPGIRSMSKLKPTKEMYGKLGLDEMKTLVRQLVNLVEIGHAKKAKGVVPSKSDVEELPGKFLLNASNLSNWNQPRYEEDLPEWRDRIASLND